MPSLANSVKYKQIVQFGKCLERNSGLERRQPAGVWNSASLPATSRLPRRQTVRSRGGKVISVLRTHTDRDACVPVRRQVAGVPSGPAFDRELRSIHLFDTISSPLYGDLFSAHN